MKWHELRRRLLAAGCTIDKGKKHHLVRDRHGRLVLTLCMNGKNGAADYHRKLLGKLRKIEAEAAGRN